MIAESILGAFAAAAILFEAQELYGVAYERRTKRIGEARERFYITARTLIDNPGLDKAHLEMMKKVNALIAHPSAPRAVATGLYITLRNKKTKKRKGPKQVKLPDGSFSVQVDFVIMSDAAMCYVAERSVLWGPYIRVLMRALFKAARDDPRRSAVMFEDIIGNGSVYPA